MKQTQNQFYGKKAEMPSKMAPGSTYICSDEDTIYHAREDGVPIPFKANTDSIDPIDIGKKLIGWQDFADSNTSASNPLEQLLVNGGDVQLTNNNNDTLTDGNTLTNSETSVKGMNDLWDTTTNTFIFSDTGVQKNDLLSFRIHVNLSASIISQDFTLRFDFFDAPGGGGSQIFSLRQHLATETLSAGVFRERIVTVDAFVGESILNGSAKIFLEGTKSFQVEVIGWNIRIFKIAR